MANYVGVGRSNAFRVRDPEGFLQWVETLSDIRAVDEGDDRYVLLCETDMGGWPAWRFLDEPNEAGEEEEELDLYGELSEHLEEGQVAVLEEVGSEKLRYLVGFAVAVNDQGETITVDLGDVYDKARQAGWGSGNIPRAVH